MVNPMGTVVEIPIGLGHVGSGGNDGLRDVVEAVRRIAGRLERAAGATFPTTPEGGVNVIARFDLSIDEPSDLLDGRQSSMRPCGCLTPSRSRPLTDWSAPPASARALLAAGTSTG